MSVASWYSARGWSVFQIILFGWLLTGLGASAEQPVGSGVPLPVVIDYFYEPGCPACLRIRNEVLPELRHRYEGFYVLNRFDTGVLSNVVRLVAYQDALGVADNSSVSMFIDYGHAFCGIEKIRSGLTPCLDARISERLAPGWRSPDPIPITQGERAAVHDRVSGFTLSAVVLAGLVDGINPCAISTLVLFMSMLLVGGFRSRRVLIMGGAFVIASFSVYTAIGLGLLRCLHLLDAFPLVAAVFRKGLGGVLLLLALFSFRDAIRYRRTRDPHQVTVKLPEGIRKWIHAVVRKGGRSHHLVVAGLIVGSVVTALETVCTGQVYVPAMALVARESVGGRAWGLLLLYNLMFVAPLIAAIVLTRFGLRTDAMLALSRKNVPFSKLLLGSFLVAVAVYLLQ